MNPPARPSVLLLAIGAVVLLAGCGVLKPTTVVTRSFVLTPIAATKAATATTENIGVAIAPLRLPPYLLKNPLAVRKGTNEVVYLENALWAEPLDQSLQRTLGANFGILIPTERIRLSHWQREEVTVAVHVIMEQFDVDDTGRGVLHAWWRITNPVGDKVLRHGESQLTRTGPPPTADPQAAAVMLSELTAEFCRNLVAPIREAAIATAGMK
jgi:uncharacterized lipoprotein YmbA